MKILNIRSLEHQNKHPLISALRKASIAWYDFAFQKSDEEILRAVVNEFSIKEKYSWILEKGYGFIKQFPITDDLIDSFDQEEMEYYFYLISSLKCGASTEFVLQYIQKNFPKEYKLYKLTNYPVEESDSIPLKYFPSSTGEHVFGICFDPIQQNFYGFSFANQMNPIDYHKYRGFIDIKKRNPNELIPVLDGKDFNRLDKVFCAESMEDLLGMIQNLEGGIWRVDDIREFNNEMNSSEMDLGAYKNL